MRIILFEVEGGNDKGPDGHRKDTMPIVHALEDAGCDVDVVFYAGEKEDELFTQASQADAYISRVNPGQLKNEEAYFTFLDRLGAIGVEGFSHPKQMQSYGAKDVLVKLNTTPLVPDDTVAYYSSHDLRAGIVKSLACGPRVLKQNRGSTGQGIRKVSLVDTPHTPGDHIPLESMIKCVEAVDNHVEKMTLEQFIHLCEQYFGGENGMMVDMKFLPRIKEGELRILYVGKNPMFVVHKKPAMQEDAFSATLFSGAAYTYHDPTEYAGLVDLFAESLPEIMSILGGDLPLIWTADFILDTDETGNDMYILGEMNCSCVGFTTHLHHGIQEHIAQELIQQLKQ